ncbi:MAG: hypothetical protein H8E32_14365 [Nitrospinae bacterium]|nr:hypothetical protein [Nitrospinota bacterium]
MYSSLIKIMAIGILSTIFLTGCGTTGGKEESVSGAPGSAEWLNSASQSTIDSHYRQVCKGYNLPSRSLVNNCVNDEIAAAKKRAGIDDKPIAGY